MGSNARFLSRPRTVGKGNQRFLTLLSCESLTPIIQVSCACNLFSIAQRQLSKTNPPTSTFTCCQETALRAVARDWHWFHCRRNGLQVIRHCFDGPQLIPGILVV